MQKRSVNKIIVVGRVGQDPKIRQTNSGTTIANVSVATTHSRKVGEGDYKDETEWHDVVVFGSTADFVKDYVNKGDVASVVGRLSTDKWEDKNGNKRRNKEIIAQEFNLYSTNNASNQNNSNQGDDDIPF